MNGISRPPVKRRRFEAPAGYREGARAGIKREDIPANLLEQNKTTITRTSTSTRVHSNDDRSPMVIAEFAVGCVVLVGAVVVALVVVHFYEKATEPAPSGSAHPSGEIVRL